MDKEKKDKLTKKSSTRKNTEESLPAEIKIAMKEVLQTTVQDVSLDDGVLSKKDKKRMFDSPSSNRGLVSKGNVAPEGFYIQHPSNVKRTAHFKDVHCRKLAELLEAFHMFDFDRDGVIDLDDLKKTFSSLCMTVDGKEIEQMLSEGLSPLNFDAFVILLGQKTLELDPEEVLLHALSNWDDHQEGFISYDRFKLHLMAWGDKFTEEEATAALIDAPVILNKSKEKMIDYVQFSEELCGLRKMMHRKQNQEEDYPNGEGQIFNNTK